MTEQEQRGRGAAMMGPEAVLSTLPPMGHNQIRKPDEHHSMARHLNPYYGNSERRYGR